MLVDLAGLHDGEDIHFHTPGRRAAAYPYEVLAAGRATAQAGEPFIRRRFNQHVLILTVGGMGHVEVDTHGFIAAPGSLAWLDTSREYAHGCAPAAESWTYLWMGVRGYGLESVFDLVRARANPIAEIIDMAQMTGTFEAVIDRLRRHANDTEPANSAAVAQVVASLVADRSPDREQSDAPAPVLEIVMRRIRGDLARTWRVADVSDLAGLSPSQLHRRFLERVGATPMDWIRRERMNAAKRLLVQSDEPISSVAARCGYPDPFHFSRDFRRVTGQSPTGFRRSQGN